MALLAFTTAPVFASCSPGGLCNGYIIGGCHSYDYLANWSFDDNCAWSYFYATRKTDNGICSGTYSGNYAQLYYSPGPAHLSRVYQTVHIPATGEAGYVSSSQSWMVGYNVDIHSHTFSHGETLQVRVINADTGAVIATGPIYYGDAVNPDCHADNFAFTANMNGKNIKVEVRVQLPIGSDYSFYNIDSITLEQNI
jgi:hypothetical protein